MATRMKMDERNEKAVRSLLKKTPNRRCINCNSLGPQYVCLNFSTFICTQCSGIHREFTHRVKSVSMSKFSSQEVENLENGGNERGREIYFKDWDSQRQPLPDSSNIERLREFIKMVYVDKRFSGERASAEGRGGGHENVRHRPESRSTYQSDSRSPTYEERYDHRPVENRGSNAGLDDTRYEYNVRKSPVRFETEQNKYSRSYNYHNQYEEKPHNEYRDKKHHEDHHSGRVEEKFSSEKGNREYGNPPPIIPVKEILGPQLRVEVHGNQTNGSREMIKSRSGQNGDQRFGSSSSFSSVEGSVTVGATSLTRENSRSLIDFLSEQNPPTTTVTVTERTDPFGLSSVVQPSSSSSSSTGWASFDTSLTMSSSTPQNLLSFATTPVASLDSTSFPSISSSGSTPTADINGITTWAPQWPAAPAASAFDTQANSRASLTTVPISSAGTQLWDAFPSSLPPAMQTESTTTHSFGTGVPDPVGSTSGGTTQSMKIPSFATTGLSEDLFDRPQISLPFSMGSSYTYQYQPMIQASMMGVGTYSQPQKSRNPFDIPGDNTPIGSSVDQFPSVASMQVALPNFGMPSMPVTGLGMSGYGVQWNRSNPAVQSQISYPLSVVENYNGQIANSSPQMMQHVMDSRITGNFLGIPSETSVSPSYLSFQNQNGVSPLYTSFQNSSYGVSAPNDEGNLLSQFPFHQSSVNMPGGNTANRRSFYATIGQQQRLMSQHSAGTLGCMFGTDPLPSGNSAITDSFYRNTGQQQRLMSQHSAGSLGCMFGTDPLPGGNSAITDSFYPNTGQEQHPMSQHSAGSLGSMFDTDPLLSSLPSAVLQGGQHNLSHSSDGAVNSMIGIDVQPPPQGSIHLNMKSSDGNPFS